MSKAGISEARQLGGEQNSVVNEIQLLVCVLAEKGCSTETSGRAAKHVLESTVSNRFSTATSITLIRIWTKPLT